MAILSVKELAELRRACARNVTPVTWTKPQINAALQAIEDWFEANRASLGAAIETAAPLQFAGPLKKRLVAFWLRQKFGREAV